MSISGVGAGDVVALEHLQHLRGPARVRAVVEAQRDGLGWHRVRAQLAMYGVELRTAALAGITVAAVLPYTPLADPLGFTALPPAYPPLMAGLVIAYLALVEVTKRELFAASDLVRAVPSAPGARQRRRVHRRAARFTIPR
jgi:hypothetical protein